jgi:hypothetical protein
MAIRYLDDNQTDIIKKPKIRYLDEEQPATGKPTFMQAVKHNLSPEGLKEDAQDLYSELISPIAHGASTFAGGIPKMVAKEEAQRNEVPEIIFQEQKTPVGKLMRAASETAGFTAGLPGRAAVFTGKALGKVIPKVVPKLLAKGTTGAAAGAVGGALAGDTLESRAELAKVGGILGGVAPVVSQIAKGTKEVVAKGGRWVAKNIGGVTDETVKVIKRLGADRVFDPEKAKSDYLGSNIVPRLQQRVNSLLVEGSPKSKMVLKEIGVKPEAIEALNKVDKNKLKQLTTVFGDDVNTGLKAIKDNADVQFKTTLERNPDVAIPPKNTFYKLQGLLRNQGWIDKSGNEFVGAGISNKTKTNLIKIYRDLKGTVGKTKSGKAYTGVPSINTAQYFNKLSELEASVSGDPKFDRLVFEVEKSLRNDAASVIKGLKQANKSYSDASALLELEPVFNKIKDSVNWEKQLLQLKDPKKFQSHQKYKKILGNDLYDDVLAHLANTDFNLVSETPGVGGGFYPSRSGIIRSAVGEATKGYYKTLAPKLERAGKFTGKISDKIKQKLLNP